MVSYGYLLTLADLLFKDLTNPVSDIEREEFKLYRLLRLKNTNPEGRWLVEAQLEKGKLYGKITRWNTSLTTHSTFCA